MTESNNQYIKDGMVEFAKTGMNLLFLAHGSAIIALLANLEKVKSINLILGNYFWLIIGGYTLGLILALVAMFAAYMCHFKLTEGAFREKTFFLTSRISGIVSFLIFVGASFFSIYLAAGMEIHLIASDLLIVMTGLFSLCFVATMVWDIK